MEVGQHLVINDIFLFRKEFFEFRLYEYFFEKFIDRHKDLLTFEILEKEK